MRDLTASTNRNTVRTVKRDTGSLGLTAPDTAKAVVITFRLKGGDARKFGKLAKRMKVGRSSMARLIIEKFIKEHDPDEEKG